MILSKSKKKQFSRNYKFLDEARAQFSEYRPIRPRHTRLMSEINRILLSQNLARRLDLDGVAWNMDWLSSTLADLAGVIENTLHDEAPNQVYVNAKRLLILMRQVTTGLRMESLVADIREEPLLIDIAREYRKEAAHMTFLLEDISNYDEFKDQLEAWSIHWFGVEGDDNLETREDYAIEIWQARHHA